MEFDCRTCGACCLGFPVFECAEEYFKKYDVLFQLRGLVWKQKDNKYYCMTQPCRHLQFKEGVYSCLIQDSKPEVCKIAKPGDETCLDARKFKL
jgi:hypothetical protein